MGMLREMHTQMCILDSYASSIRTFWKNTHEPMQKHEKNKIKIGKMQNWSYKQTLEIASTRI